MDRRSFIDSLIASCMAPAVVQSSSLMNLWNPDVYGNLLVELIDIEGKVAYSQRQFMQVASPIPGLRYWTKPIAIKKAGVIIGSRLTGPHRSFETIFTGGKIPVVATNTLTLNYTLASRL